MTDALSPPLMMKMESYGRGGDFTACAEGGDVLAQVWICINVPVGAVITKIEERLNGMHRGDVDTNVDFHDDDFTCVTCVTRDVGETYVPQDAEESMMVFMRPLLSNGDKYTDERIFVDGAYGLGSRWM